MFSILKVLNMHQGPMHSIRITRELEMQGFKLSERTVRYYLKQLDKLGYTERTTKRGRQVTRKGKDELASSFTTERVGFIIDTMNNLSFMATLNPDTLRGTVILNITFIEEEAIYDAIKLLKVTLNSPYAISNRVIIQQGGGYIGHIRVPDGVYCIGTVCSVTLNAIFLKAGIPVRSKFGGIVEVIDRTPARFLSLISYQHSSVPPLELFMKSRMTDVLGALKTGTGKILGSFREIPGVSINDAKRLSEKMVARGFGGIILFGQPGKSVLDIPVTSDTVGIVVLGGLNPVAAFEEAQIPTKTHAMATLVDYLELNPIEMYDMRPASTFQNPHSTLSDMAHMYHTAATAHDCPFSLD